MRVHVKDCKCDCRPPRRRSVNLEWAPPPSVLCLSLAERPRCPRRPPPSIAGARKCNNAARYSFSQRAFHSIPFRSWEKGASLRRMVRTRTRTRTRGGRRSVGRCTEEARDTYNERRKAPEQTACALSLSLSLSLSLVCISRSSAHQTVRWILSPARALVDSCM